MQPLPSLPPPNPAAPAPNPSQSLSQGPSPRVLDPHLASVIATLPLTDSSDPILHTSPLPTSLLPSDPLHSNALESVPGQPITSVFNLDGFHLGLARNNFDAAEVVDLLLRTMRSGTINQRLKATQIFLKHALDVEKLNGLVASVSTQDKDPSNDAPRKVSGTLLTSRLRTTPGSPSSRSDSPSPVSSFIPPSASPS